MQIFQLHLKLQSQAPLPVKGRDIEIEREPKEPTNQNLFIIMSRKHTNQIQKEMIFTAADNVNNIT